MIEDINISIVKLKELVNIARKADPNFYELELVEEIENMVEGLK